MHLKTIVVFVLASISVVLYGQKIRQGGLSPTPEELSLQSACTKVSALLIRIGRQDPGRDRYWIFLKEQIVFGRRVRVWDISCQRELLVLLDSRTGVILAYHDLKKQADQHYGRNRTKARFFSNSQEAKSKFLATASILGIPSNWQLDNFEIKADEQTDRASHGHVGARFKDGTGKLCATLALDCQDGKVIAFTRRAP